MVRPPLSCVSVVVVLLFHSISYGSADELTGRRPYEMQWANRHEDSHPAVIDFENLDGWIVACSDSEATFERSQQQQLWGQYVGTLTYRATGPKPVVAVKAPAPIALPQSFDCINVWLYGNNWSYDSVFGGQHTIHCRSRKTNRRAGEV